MGVESATYYRAFDADTVVGTMIADLQANGTLK